MVVWRATPRLPPGVLLPYSRPLSCALRLGVVRRLYIRDVCLVSPVPIRTRRVRSFKG